MTKKEIKKLEDKIFNYKTKYKHGFTTEEQEELLKTFPHIDRKVFNEAMGVHTVIEVNKEILTYHIDIYRAILCGLENRELRIEEWD